MITSRGVMAESRSGCRSLSRIGVQLSDIVSLEAMQPIAANLRADPALPVSADSPAGAGTRAGAPGATSCSRQLAAARLRTVTKTNLRPKPLRPVEFMGLFPVLL